MIVTILGVAFGMILAPLLISILSWGFLLLVGAISMIFGKP